VAECQRQAKIGGRIRALLAANRPLLVFFSTLRFAYHIQMKPELFWRHPTISLPQAKRGSLNAPLTPTLP